MKAALYRRHPASYPDGSQGPWTCLEEWANIDFLATSAWSSCRPFPPHAVVGYEVKVSRSDYRRELVNPGKRSRAVKVCHEFWFAVPFGLLKPDEMAWRPPPALTAHPSPFTREPCPGAYGGRCYQGKVRMGMVDRRTDEQRRGVYAWERRDGGGRWRDVDYAHAYSGPCPTCRGAGYVQEAPAVLADAPYIWVPDDVGLLLIHENGDCEVARKAPRRTPEPLVTGLKQTADLIRWVATRPDRRRVRESFLTLAVDHPPERVSYGA